MSASVVEMRAQEEEEEVKVRNWWWRTQVQSVLLHARSSQEACPPGARGHSVLRTNGMDTKEEAAVQTEEMMTQMEAAEMVEEVVIAWELEEVEVIRHDLHAIIRHQKQSTSSGYHHRSYSPHASASSRHHRRYSPHRNAVAEVVHWS